MGLSLNANSEVGVAWTHTSLIGTVKVGKLVSLAATGMLDELEAKNDASVHCKKE
jgi:hypothetical protein